jgi:S-DNA-T family DNA segregation ATPase FtsK/SpoIIIE
VPTRQKRRRAASSRGRRSSGSRAWNRVSDAAGRQLGGHAADAIAVGLLVFGALTTIGLVSNAAGPVGDGLAGAAKYLLGRGAVLVPSGCVAFAVLLWVQPRGDDTREPAPLRIGLGVGLLVISAVGLLGLGGGVPAPSVVRGQLETAGGWIGAVIAYPLSGAAGIAGAAIVLVAIGVLGALLAPGVPMRDVLAAIGRGTRGIARRLHALFQFAPAPDDDEADPDIDVDFDFGDEDETAVVDLTEPERWEEEEEEEEYEEDADLEPAAEDEEYED